MCSLCAVPEAGTGSPHLLRSPQSCRVALAAQRIRRAHRLHCSLHPLLPCRLGSRPQTSAFLGSVLILGLGLPEHGTLFHEEWVLLRAGTGGAKQQGEAMAVSHMGLGPAGFLWRAGVVRTSCGVLSLQLALLFPSRGPSESR